MVFAFKVKDTGIEKNRGRGEERLKWEGSDCDRLIKMTFKVSDVVL